MATPLRFAEVLADPAASPISVAAAVSSAGSVDGWPPSPLLDGWKPLLGPLAALDATTTYVGTFGLAVRRAVEGFSGLGARDRRAAVLVLLQRTAIHAATPMAFEEALRAIQRAAPDALTVGDVLSTALWACSVTHRRDGQDPLALALPAALAVLTTPGGPWLDGEATSALQDAARRLPAHVIEGLVPTIDRLHGADRRLVREAFGLPDARRRWLLRR